MSTSSTAWETLLTPKEIQAYGQLFNSVSTSTPGIITGQEAVRFFATSGVPNEILSEIWEAADKNNCGYLTPETFSLALKLIACAQHGREVSEPVFATVVPLPQFENTPLDTAASVVKSPPSAVDTITLEEREMYMSIFCAQDPKRTTMDAEIAKNILMKSKLPTDTLGQIWQLANGRQTGNLNTTEFVIAMHYVAKLMNGTLKALPAQLPPHIYAAASGTVPKEILPSLTSPHPMHSRVATPVHRNMTPPQRARTIDSLGSMAFASTATPAAHQWEITAQERAHSDGIFDQLDTHRVGILQGKEAVEFFKNSKLPDSELAAIWDMADTRRSGQLTREEFTIAMHLIQKRLTGDLLATDVPTGFATDMVNSPIVMPRFVSSVAPTSDPFMSAQDEDLLGEFGDEEQLTNDTNQVNQLQNQMAALQEASADVKARKEAKEKVLVQIMEQKQSVLEQTVQLQHSRDTELKTLKALEAVVEEEKPEWLQTQQEHDGAQQQLDVLQQEIDQLKQTFEEGQTENNRLRRQVATIQGEAAQCTRQLEKIRLKTLWTASGPGHTTTGVSSSESESKPSPFFSPVPEPSIPSIESRDSPFLPSPEAQAGQTPPLKASADFDAIFGHFAVAGNHSAGKSSLEIEQPDSESESEGDSEGEGEGESESESESAVSGHASGHEALGNPFTTHTLDSLPTASTDEPPHTLRKLTPNSVSPQTPTDSPATQKITRPPPPPPQTKSQLQENEPSSPPPSSSPLPPPASSNTTATDKDNTSSSNLTTSSPAIEFDSAFGSNFDSAFDTHFDDAFDTSTYPTNHATTTSTPKEGSFSNDFDDAFVISPANHTTTASKTETKAEESDVDFEDAFADFESRRISIKPSTSFDFSFVSKADEPEEWDSIFNVSPVKEKAPKGSGEGSEDETHTIKKESVITGFEDAFSSLDVSSPPISSTEKTEKHGEV